MVQPFSYTSFLSSRGQPLIDLSLYVSSENYFASTRPAYSHILQWPNTWLLPPKRRAAAKVRTDHLNFSALDLDTATHNDEEKVRSQFAAGTEIPTRLLPSTARPSLARQRQHASARFRLDTLAEAFFEPLTQLLQGKYHLLSEERMTSLDCLALAYLSLALVPEVPQPWLSQLMKERYPTLCHYIEDLARDCFGIVLSAQKDKARELNTPTRLPWKELEPATLVPRINVKPLLESIPLFGYLYRPYPLQQSTTKSHSELSGIPIIPTVFLGLFTSVAALGIHVLWTGELPSPPSAFLLAWPYAGRQRKQRLNEMGEAGAMLGALRL
ncbi:MAG: hypothetical protein Q9166_006100 [cf. Caloplaca sp. 2 TL-2023]